MSGLTVPASAASVASAAQHTLRRHNVSAIMRAVLAEGPLSRTEIGRRTGLSPGAVTRLTQPMVQAGLLAELPSRTGGPSGGRPSVPLDLDTRARVVLGIHIGIEYTRAGLVDLRAQVTEERVVAHRSSQPEALLEQAAQLAAGLIADSGRGVLSLAATIGGVVDDTRGVVVENLPLGWRGVPVRDELSRRLGQPVLLDSTVRAIALAEVWFGQAPAESLVHLFVGNVVGAAIVLRRELYRGHGAAAGTLTHVPVNGRATHACRCGRRDCFEVVASNRGVLDYGRDRGIVAHGESLESVLGRARQGDRRADGLLRRQARHVGEVCGLLLDVIDPEVITLSGWFTQAQEYLAQVPAGLGRSASAATADASSRIRGTSFAGDQLIVGAAALPLSAYFNDPLAFEPDLAAVVTE